MHCQQPVHFSVLLGVNVMPYGVMTQHKQYCNLFEVLYLFSVKLCVLANDWRTD